MANNPDQPVAPGPLPDTPDVLDTPDDAQPDQQPPQPQPNQPPFHRPTNIEIDRMVEAIYGQSRERVPHAVNAREREGRARGLLDLIPQNIRDMAPRWGRPLARAILKRLACLGEAMNSDLASFPFLHQPRRGGSEWVEEHVFDFGRERGRGEVRSFYSMLVHHEIFKAFKQEARQGCVLTPERRQAIQNQIVREQTHDPKEVIRQERTLEDFNCALRRGEYTTASQIYDAVKDYNINLPFGLAPLRVEQIDKRALHESHIAQRRLDRVLEHNADRKLQRRENPEAIERRYAPEGTNRNIPRNELLQKYLRIAASQHIADMIEGHSDYPHAQFLVMFRNFRPIEQLTRDDIPLDEDRIAPFFEEVQGDVRESILSALRERQDRQDSGEHGGVVGDAHDASLRRRIDTALNLGIITREDLGDISPELDPGRHLVEEGAAVTPITRDRVERAYTDPERAGIIAPDAVPASPEIRAQTFERLRAALQRDVDNDNDDYSNFDAERARILERIDTFPRIAVTHTRTERDKKIGKNVFRSVTVEEPSVQPALDALKVQRDANLLPITQAFDEEVRTLQRTGGADVDMMYYARVRQDAIKRQYAQARAELLAQTSILTPAELAHEVMDEDFRQTLMNRLYDAFVQDYDKFARQRNAVSRDRDETYAPYRLLTHSDMDDVRRAIRAGAARDKLVAATLRGDAALDMEEQQLVRFGIFSREELDERRRAFNLIVGAHRQGMDEQTIRNSEEQMIANDIFTREELEQLREEIERRAQEA